MFTSGFALQNIRQPSGISTWNTAPSTSPPRLQNRRARNRALRQKGHVCRSNVRATAPANRPVYVVYKNGPPDGGRIGLSTLSTNMALLAEGEPAARLDYKHGPPDGGPNRAARVDPLYKHARGSSPPALTTHS